MAQKASFAPVDKRAADRNETDRLDLEMHARSEAGLTESFPASDAASAAKAAPTVEDRQTPSFWQAKNQEDIQIDQLGGFSSRRGIVIGSAVGDGRLTALRS